jgi:hypothetical protein
MVIMLLNYTLKLMLLSKVSDMQGNSLYRPYDLKDFNAMRIRFFYKTPTAYSVRNHTHELPLWGPGIKA